MNRSAEFLVEQPRDPEEWRRRDADQLPHPSFLAWPETRMVQKHLQLVEIKLDQGAVGHKAVKPTTSPMSRRSIRWMDCELLLQVSLGSKSLAAWAPGLVGVPCRRQSDGSRKRWLRLVRGLS